MGRRVTLLVCLMLCAVVAAPAAAARGGDEFAAIDAHALAASASDARSASSLAAYLTRPARDDREKARAIFRWIAHYISYDRALLGKPADPESVLKQRRAVCTGYAVLFKALAEASGLEAEIVEGHSKDAGYQVGRTAGTTPNHAWNAVKIDGQWRLLDCCWGAGRFDGSGRFVRRFTDHYFLTPPERFAADHFPENARWQLLDPPISGEDYLNRARLKPAFFECGLWLVSHRSARIEAGDSLSVTIGAPPDAILSASLWQGGRELGAPYTFAERQKDAFRVRVAFPRRGEYILRVYAAADYTRGDELEWVLDYAVTAQSGSNGSEFPKTYGAFLTRNCRLDRPLRRALEAGKTVGFSLTVPGAEEVVVRTNGGAKSLAARGGGEFFGDTLIAGGPVTVFAKFPGKTRYEGLLQYVGR